MHAWMRLCSQYRTHPRLWLGGVPFSQKHVALHTLLLVYCSWFPIIVECLSFYDYEQFWTVLRDISKSVYYVSNESLSRRFCLPDLASDLCHIFRQYYGMKSLYWPVRWHRAISCAGQCWIMVANNILYWVLSELRTTSQLSLEDTEWP